MERPFRLRGYKSSTTNRASMLQYDQQITNLQTYTVLEDRFHTKPDSIALSDEKYLDPETEFPSAVFAPPQPGVEFLLQGDGKNYPQV